MAFELPQLPFSKDAFGSFITSEGFDYHHGKHHAAYVTNLNNLVKDTPWENKNLEEIIVASHTEKNAPIFNNSAQVYNHTFFWNCISPNGGGAPTGKIMELINRDFGGFDTFKEQFSSAAVKLFGSGWAWLTMNAAGKLEIKQYANAGTPATDNLKGVLTVDVWEHAYYIDHRNARPKFVDMYWDVVNWNFANTNL